MDHSKISPVRLEGIGKCYRIFQNPQDRFKQALIDRFQNIVGKRNASPLFREHWALKDVSFELAPGEAVGILGRNGAGKSTLLQIIAGTLQPTEGSIQTSGRITALLELGSGFNPEFTGRENVFLNGQIFGLSKEDVLNKFDDIAAFADIGDFIDQPVKTYSSGMMMRLAFAVQTALTPTMFIVDEALAVGDVFFQAKCMRRLRQMRESGTTILFVSHAATSVRELCTRALLLDHGRLLADDSPSNVVHRYLELVARHQSSHQTEYISGHSNLDGGEEIEQKQETESSNPDSVEINKTAAFEGVEIFEKLARENRTGNQKATFLNVVLLNRLGKAVDEFSYDEDVTCRMVVKINEDVSNLWIGYKIRTVSGVDIIHADSSLCELLSYEYRKGEIYVLDWFFSMRLMHGGYCLGCAIGMPDPPTGIGRVMEYVDIVNVARAFSVAPRSEGMIGGTAVWDNKLEINTLRSL